MSVSPLFSTGENSTNVAVPNVAPVVIFVSVTLQERLRARRRERGLTKEQLAEAARLSVPSIYNYENEKTGREPKVGDLKALARALNTTVAFLVGETDDPSPDALQPRRSFRLQTTGEVSTEEVRLIDLRLERLEMLEREQHLASERRKALDEEIKALEETIRQRRESDEGNG